MTTYSSSTQEIEAPPSRALVNKYLERNNQKALDMLLRMQSQLEASRVIATSSVVERNYE